MFRLKSLYLASTLVLGGLFTYCQAEENRSSVHVHAWPKEIRMVGNGKARLPLPPGIRRLRVVVPPDMAPALEAHVTGPNGTLRVDGPEGARVETLGEPQELRLKLDDDKIQWSRDDNTTARRSMGIETHGDLGSYTKQIQYVVLPALTVELRPIAARQQGDALFVRLSLQDRLKGEVPEGGGRRVWAETKLRKKHFDAQPVAFDAVPVGAREWQLTLPSSLLGFTILVRYEQDSWQHAYIRMILEKHGAGVRIRELDSTLARSKFITLPDYRKWQRIGPNFPKGFKASTHDAHDTMGVYAPPSAMERYRRAGEFPVGTVLVKISQPISVSEDDKIVKRFKLLEPAQYVGGKQPNWIYGAAIVEEEPKPGTKIYALPDASCFNCHFTRGRGNVFVDRYAALAPSAPK